MFSRALNLAVLNLHLLTLFLWVLQTCYEYSCSLIFKGTNWYVYMCSVLEIRLHVWRCECEFLLLCSPAIYWVSYSWGFVINTFIWSVYVQFGNTTGMHCSTTGMYCVISLRLYLSSYSSVSLKLRNIIAQEYWPLLCSNYSLYFHLCSWSTLAKLPHP